MIVYGYRALSIFLKNIDNERLEKSDWDLLLTFEELNRLIDSLNGSATLIKPRGKDGYLIKTPIANYDIHLIIYENSNKYLYDNQSEYLSNETLIDPYGNEYKVPSIKTLFEFKKSHRIISKGFDKTMRDYYQILDEFEINSNEESQFYKSRYKETLIRAINQTNHINLNQTKHDFFKTKNVTYIFDHDSIHESIKLTEEPIYKKILKPNEEVLCSQELWNKTSDLEKKYCVLEESYTIAIERLLSKGHINDPKEAFLMALERVCTTLTKGWCREYAVFNYREIVNMYSDRFWIKFQEDLKNGLIKPF